MRKDIVYRDSRCRTSCYLDMILNYGVIEMLFRVTLVVHYYGPWVFKRQCKYYAICAALISETVSQED